MKKEFLEDYSKKEREEWQKYNERINTYKKYFFPPRNRFHKLNEPISFQAPGSSPWSQIPFCGSLIIGLFPMSKEKFAEVHGFSHRDIDKLIDVAKDSGKVQFVLASDPVDFTDLEHYDSIFEEIKPPILRANFPLKLLGQDEGSARHYRAEFLEVAKAANLLSFLNSLFETYGVVGGYVKERFKEFVGTYTILRMLGHNEAADRILNLLIDDIKQAHKLLYFYKHFVVNPVLKFIPGVQNTTTDYLRIMTEIQSNDKSTSITFPVEIGKFLMKKLVLYPESYEACNHVLMTYEKEDLLNVLSSLQKAIRSAKFDKINYEAKNLDNILDNVWNDSSKIEKIKKIVQQGVPLSLAALGYVAAGPIAAVGGFLAGLGLEVASNTMNNTAEYIAKKLPKFFSPNYLLAVYDFKKKYNLK